MLSYLIRLPIFENFFKHKERYFCGYKEMEQKEVKNKARVFTPQRGGQEAFVKSNVDVCFFGGVLNCGKAQPVDSKVITPFGETTIGDLLVGDIVSGFDGKSQMVLGIYDKGQRDIIRLHFDNGLYIDCCEEHLWNIYSYRKNKIVTVDTNYIIKQLEKKRIHIPLCHPVEFECKGNLPIHPYTLGALIGDGTFTNRESSIKIATDDEIVNRISQLENVEVRKYTPKDRYQHFTLISNDIRRGLESLGLMESHSYEKFIPECYKYTSVENRKELIRGLFDTDGYNDKRANRIEYTTTSKRLADDIRWIIHSLGGKTSVCVVTGKYRDRYGKQVVCRTAYRIQCRIENRNNLFTLERKKVYRSDNKRIFNDIVCYERLGKTHMKCIKVSNEDELYLTDNFVVTHNTFGAILTVAEWSKIPQFRAVFTRRNLQDTKAGGGMADEFQNIYGDSVQVKLADSPRITFPSGAFVDITHIADENPAKLMERVKGWQYDMVYMDELTSYQWSTFNTIITRNRGSAGIGSKIRGTTNPKRNHWLRVFLKPYIGYDGFIRPDMDRKVMYFFIEGETVQSVVWGETKEEVYQKCKVSIDRKLKAVNKGAIKFTYENLIKSFSFILGNISENIASLGANKDYIGSVAASGGKRGQILLEGNWNVDEDDDSEAPIPTTVARESFLVDPQRNGDRWVTVDLADYGTDNLVAIAWDGLHIIDIMILGRTTPRMNADKILLFATKWDVADSHIIFDGTNGRYINDYIPDAIPFVSFSASCGMYARSAALLKDECYLRLKYLLNNGMISWDDEVATRRYYHQKMKEEISIQTEFIEECAVVRFKDQPSGKKRLLNKKEMNQMLGKGRSMDLLDPIAYRMYPLLEYQYGEELIKTAVFEEPKKEFVGKRESIYNDSFWA